MSKRFAQPDSEKNQEVSCALHEEKLGQILESISMVQKSLNDISKILHGNSRRGLLERVGLLESKFWILILIMMVVILTIKV